MLLFIYIFFLHDNFHIYHLGELELQLVSFGYQWILLSCQRYLSCVIDDIYLCFVINT